jgi:hypothetical protein
MSRKPVIVILLRFLIILFGHFRNFPQAVPSKSLSARLAMQETSTPLGDVNANWLALEQMYCSCTYFWSKIKNWRLCVLEYTSWPTWEEGKDGAARAPGLRGP